MGIWSNEWDNSYAAHSDTYSTKHIITYTNNSLVRERIRSIAMPMGTGQGTYTAGDTATGDGSAITFYVYANGDSKLSSIPITVSTVVGSSSGSTGTYPPKDAMVMHTIEFGIDIIVEPNSTIYFTFASNAEQSSSQVFVWDNTRISGVVEPINQVWRYNGELEKWEKVLIPKIYRNGIWEDMLMFYTSDNDIWNIGKS